MIDFKRFQYASAPRTGSTWFTHACYNAMGVSCHKAAAHVPHTASGLSMRVSSVRHPADWIVSYWRSIHPGVIGVPEVDKFRQLPVSDFRSFIRQYLKRMPGQVGRMFLAYNADTYLRVEDYPANAVELFEMVGVPRQRAIQAHSVPAMNLASNKVKVPVWSSALLDRFCEAEMDALERFDYEFRNLHTMSSRLESVTK